MNTLLGNADFIKWKDIAKKGEADLLEVLEGMIMQFNLTSKINLDRVKVIYPEFIKKL